MASIVVVAELGEEEREPTVQNTDRLLFSARASSSSSSSSPRNVHAANPRKATPATIEMASVGNAYRLRRRRRSARWPGARGPSLP